MVYPIDTSIYLQAEAYQIRTVIQTTVEWFLYNGHHWD